MTSALNNYEVLLTSEKWNKITLEHEQIVELTTVVDKLKDNNQIISKLFKTAPRKKSWKGNQTQSGNNNGRKKSKGK